MSKIEKGQVFSFKTGDTKYVYYAREFKAWHNAGGFGDYTHFYIKLDNLLKLGNVKDTEELSKYTESCQDNNFEDKIEIHTDEAPFEITSRTVVLFTVRRKELKTILTYE